MKTLELLNKDGKKLPKSYYNTLNKLVANHKLLEDYAKVGDKPIAIRTNPYSGAQVELSAIAADLADWIVSSNPIVKPFTQSDWDNARYTFMVCWPDAYYALID